LIIGGQLLDQLPLLPHPVGHRSTLARHDEGGGLPDQTNEND
jgi:hypothetical protein